MHGDVMTARMVVYIAASLDGFIATPDGGVDWLEPFHGQDFGYEAFAAGIATVVMGRLSFEQVQGFGTWPYQGKQAYILAAQRPDVLPERAEHWSGGLGDLVRRLKAGPGDVWIMGGGKTIRGFMDLGAVDRIELFVMPLLLGDGIPLFQRSPQRASLKLEASKAFPSGVVQLSYGVV